MRTASSVFVLLTLAGSLFFLTACETGSETTISGPDPEGPPTVILTFRNLGTEAWIATNVQGADGVVDAGTENPTLRLNEGVRFVVENDAGVTDHPFALRGPDGTILLNQRDGGGSLSNEPDINFTADDDGMAFTFTRSLSQEVATYNCLNHVDMEGTVVTADAE
ncbi:hypothetical protein [Longibacter sp.]|uniref:hypothetical protein n=1 Tax=Longibacter sp. TaxID=2045415 RepID=UPI003EC116E7